MAARAERQHETRRRIVQAVFELHGEVGPARTTISAIAERAGVERLTVYRHFPDLPSVFAACGAHFFQAFPRPDVASWGQTGNPAQALRDALSELYAWYGAVGPYGFGRVLRDAPDLPDLAALIDAHWERPAAEARARLAALWCPAPAARAAVEAAIHLAMQLSTWETLTAAGLDHDAAVSLMVNLVRAAVGCETSA